MTETLMAVGTLAIGLMFIGGTFLTGIFFASTSTERTIAAVAADEAFAKIRIHGLDPNNVNLRPDSLVPYEQLAVLPLGANELLYPSTPRDPAPQYSWAALCRQLQPGSRLVQCTVFVSRQTPGALYWDRQSGTNGAPLATKTLPRPVRISLAQDVTSADASEVLLKDAVPADTVDELAFVSDGSVLVDDRTGLLYRVLERYARQPDKVRLDRPWTGGASGSVWVVPPAVSGGRDPMVATYQQVLRFPGS